MKFKQLNLGRWLIFGAMGMFPLSLSGGLTGYLKIGDISGESQRAGHEDEIDFYGLEWRIERPSPTSGSTRDRAGAEVKPMVVRKRIDKSSPYLALATLNGQVLPSITIAVSRDSGGAHLDYLIITMENVKVVSYGMKSADGETEPTEEVGFVFETITYKYTVQADDHSAGDEHEITYDIAAGV